MSCQPYVDPLWTPDDPPPGVRAYIRAHYEFDWNLISSDYPYEGVRWSDRFKSSPRCDRYGIPKPTLGHGWRPRRDHILNNLTADLIAAAELLGVGAEIETAGGWPGGLGAEGVVVSIPLLDGELSVAFTMSEHQTTNRVHAWQVTLVTGPLALRALVELLGFSPPGRRLRGEARAPGQKSIAEEVGKRLEAAAGRRGKA